LSFDTFQSVTDVIGKRMTPTVVKDVDVNVTESLTYNVTNLTDGMMSDTPLMLYQLFGELICSFGVACNVINLCVLSQKELYESPYVYLIALAFSDVTFLILSLIHLLSYTNPATGFFTYFNAYAFFVGGNICFYISVWLIVFITIERMTFVLWPMKFKPSRRKAFVVIFLIVGFCTFIYLPRAFCLSVATTNTGYTIKSLPFRGSKQFYYLSWFYSAINTFIPNLILIVTNTILIKAIRKAATERVNLRSNQSEASRQDERRLTRMLIAIVIVFFICTVPSAFSDDPISYALFGEPKGRTWMEHINSQENTIQLYVNNILLYLNSSLNFILYCAFNRKYRMATKHFFRRLKSSVRQSNVRHHNHSLSSITTTTIVHNNYMCVIGALQKFESKV